MTKVLSDRFRSEILLPVTENNLLGRPSRGPFIHLLSNNAEPELKHLVFEVQEGFSRDQQPELCEEGVGGTYFMLNKHSAKLAVFKPSDEEAMSVNNPKGLSPDPVHPQCGDLGNDPFRMHSNSNTFLPVGYKPGIEAGGGFIRERAAYLLDYDHFASVPRTDLALCSHPSLYSSNLSPLSSPISSPTPPSSFNNFPWSPSRLSNSWKNGLAFTSPLFLASLSSSSIFPLVSSSSSLSTSTTSTTTSTSSSSSSLSSISDTEVPNGNDDSPPLFQPRVSVPVSIGNRLPRSKDSQMLLERCNDSNDRSNMMSDPRKCIAGFGMENEGGSYDRGNICDDNDAYQPIKIGSFQEFVEHDDSAEDVGSLLIAKFPVDEVHKIAILDIRLYNMDRHGGNILYRQERHHVNGQSVFKLIPIDHAYTIPSSLVHLPDFVWMTWPQSNVRLSPRSKQYIEELDIERDIRTLKKNFPKVFSRSHFRILKISIMLLKKAITFDLTPWQIGSMMGCGFDGQQTSTLQSLVEQAWKNLGDKHLIVKDLDDEEDSSEDTEENEENLEKTKFDIKTKGEKEVSGQANSEKENAFLRKLSSLLDDYICSVFRRN